LNDRALGVRYPTVEEPYRVIGQQLQAAHGASPSPRAEHASE
jgi:hypothetical protein